MNLLHLSDIHFGRNFPENKINDSFQKHDEIINEAINKIASLSSDLLPEHIIVTGDIGWCGKKEEYDEAEVWFNKLLKACHLSGKDITFIVGNHDIDRSFKPDNIQIKLNDINKIDELYRYENTHLMEPALYQYNEFCKNMGMIPFCYPTEKKNIYSYSVGYKDIITKENHKIRFLAFNTSLLSPLGFRGDNMWLGQPQIDTLCEYGILPVKDEICFTVGLFHHADRFLHPNETSSYDGRKATMEILNEFTNLLLCGHSENAGKPRIIKQSSGATCFSAGSTYYSDTHRNSFSLIFINEFNKKISFLPYVYEDGWKNYDFSVNKKEVIPSKVYPKERTIIPQAKLYLDDQVIIVNNISSYLNNTWLNNHMDIMADIGFEYKDEKLHLYIPERKKHNASSIVNLLLLKNSRYYQIKLMDGTLLAKGKSIVFDKPINEDLTFLNSIIMIQDHFKVHFTIPEQIKQSEIDLLNSILRYLTLGVVSKESENKTINLVLNEQRLVQLKDILNEKEVYFTVKKDVIIHLFGIDLKLENVQLFYGPYHFEKDDIAYKIETIKKDDLRTITFIPKQTCRIYYVSNLGYLDVKPIIECLETEIR